IGFADDDFRDQVCEKEALAGAVIGRGGNLLRAEGSRQRSDKLVDRRALLGSRGEIEATQTGVDVIAGGLEDRLQKIVYTRVQARHLRRKAEQLDAMLGGGFVLKPVEGLLAQTHQQLVEFVGN